jgi:hypothetical protein
MIDLAPATEHEMIAAFLQAEINSSRYGDLIKAALRQIGFARLVIDAPDTSDANANAVRRSVFAAYRGYPNGLLFTGFPPVTWHRVRLEFADFQRMRYANHPTLVALSGASRLVSDGAANFAARIPGAAVMGHVANIIPAIQAGKAFPPLVAAQDTDGSLILVEGHSRATAYVITGPVTARMPL